MHPGSSIHMTKEWCICTYLVTFLYFCSPKYRYHSQLIETFSQIRSSGQFEIWFLKSNLCSIQRILPTILHQCNAWLYSIRYIIVNMRFMYLCDPLFFRIFQQRDTSLNILINTCIYLLHRSSWVTRSGRSSRCYIQRNTRCLFMTNIRLLIELYQMKIAQCPKRISLPKKVIFLSW